MTAGCRCGRKWTSLIEAHCSVCHSHFTNVTNFDRHRPARGGCPNPATIRDSQGRPILKPRTRPHGVTWTSAQERPPALNARTKERRNPPAGTPVDPRLDPTPYSRPA